MRKLIGPMALLVCALVLLPTLAGADDGDSRWLYQQRLDVGRALIEVQAGNWPTIIPYYTEDIEYHDPVVDIHGIDNMTEFLARMFTNSPNLITTIEDETLVGRVYSATWTMTGDFGGVPYTAQGISVIRFKRWSARVYYQRDYYTEADIMIGIPELAPVVDGFRTFYRCTVDPTFECPLRDVTHEVDALSPADDAMGLDDDRSRWFSLWRLRRERLEVGRALIEINAGNWQQLLPFYTNDIEYRDPIVEINGLGTMAEFLGRLFAASPDLITTVDSESLVNGIYTATWTMEGLFAGVPIVAKGMSIVKFRGWTARAYYARDYYSEGDIFAGIPELAPIIDGFRTYYRCAVDPTFDCPPGGLATLRGDDLEVHDKSETPTITSFQLAQNAPNPFNPATEIAFVVPDGGAPVTLRIFDISGRLVRTLVDGHEPGGQRSVTWQGRNDQGQAVASGTYFYQLTGPSYSQMKSMVLLK